MKRMMLTVATGALIGAAPLAAAQETAAVVEVTEAPGLEERPVIDLALCLDTSGSMEGLIDAARMKLWEIVNDLALAEPTPRLRVALLTYGNDGHRPEDGWVRIDSSFTEDLDRISEQLFALTTNGGTEYVGRVMNFALADLEWAEDVESLRLIVVAGNESADQDGEVSFRDVCKDAISRDIIVNSIYCGDPSDNIAPAWREVALLADGRFASIDQNHGTIVVETPFDEQLAELSAAMNETYLPFGAAGEDGSANQWAQDSNAATMNKAAAASRAVSKGGALYFCSWDLVDACEAEQIKLEEVKTEDLPEAMQSMTLDERRAHVESMAMKRSEIQTRIQEVNAERQAFIQQEMARQAADPSRAFDTALRGAIREQAGAKGLEFPNELQPPPTSEAMEENSSPAPTSSIFPVQTLQTTQRGQQQQQVIIVEQQEEQTEQIGDGG